MNYLQPFKLPTWKRETNFDAEVIFVKCCYKQCVTALSFPSYLEIKWSGVVKTWLDWLWINLQPEYGGKNPVWWLCSFMVDHGFLASILDRRCEEDVVLCFLRHMFLTWLVRCSWNCCWSSWKRKKCSTSFQTLVVTVWKLSAEPGGFV